MSYKIAVASSDGVYIDLPFGSADKFIIYEVDENREYLMVEIRKWEDTEAGTETTKKNVACGGGCSNVSAGTGCGGANIRKVSLIEDCRSIVCAEVGFKVRKQFAARAISVFDVEGKIQETLEKIIGYYDKIDHHQVYKINE